MKNIILISILFLAPLAQSQEIKTITLKDAITYALENKADAKKAKLKVTNSDYQIQEVQSRALPQIAGNASLTYNPILQTSIIDGSNFGQPGSVIKANFGQPWSSTAGISLNQILFDNTVFIGLKAAKSTKEFYQINEQLTEEQVIERVASAYYQVYVQRQNLEVIDANLKNTTKVKDIIKGLFDSGLSKKIDLDRISVKISNLNTQRLQILNAVDLLENALKFYMGMPIETKIDLPKTTFETAPQVLSEDPDVTKRTEYLLLQKSEQLFEYQKKSYEAAYYPSLSLSAGYNFIGQGPKMPLFAKPEDGVFWSDFASVGLNLRVPIFSGFGIKAKVKQAKISIENNKIDMEDTKLALNMGYQNAKKQIESSIIAINIQKENVELAQKVLNNTNNNYKQGLASLTDLLDAETANTDAQNNYTNSLLNYKLAEIQLIKSKGELKTLINK